MFNSKLILNIFLIILLGINLGFAQDKLALPADADPNDENWKGIDNEKKEPIQPLSPSDQQALFQLPEGYIIEPILTEPQIEQPAAIAFDGMGRMYVLELRTYMLDADSNGELEPKSRISRWEDKDGDGIYETGTAFVDNLIFPRFVLPYGKDCILSMESDQDEVYKYTDTDGDGIADKKEFFTNKYGRSGNVEHQQAFMYWGMDNWLYSTVNAFRIRETENGIIRENTGSNRAQWGLTHDLDGKLWFQGGASGVPSYFQFPIHYGNYTFKDEIAEGFRVPYGAAVKIADMQGGMDEIRQPDGSLNGVTGSSGNDVYKGTNWPKEMVGQYFYGEPVARIVRQINPELKEGLTTIHNVYQEEKSEFLRSTDPLFRPVDMATAPDGSMYIVDMYHGIIQEGQWTPQGSYLRFKIEQYQLDKMVGMGRIWRIRYKGNELNKKKPNFYSIPSKELIQELANENGWWRDAAQQELVLRKDMSIVPELIKMAKTGSYLSRTHALWTLEGLNQINSKLILELMQDKNPKIQIQAMRVGESLVKRGNQELNGTYQELVNSSNDEVAIQAILSMKFLKIPELKESVEKVLAKNNSKGVQLVGSQSIEEKKETNNPFWGGNALSDEQMAIIERGKSTFNELCSQCHGNTGMGTDLGDGRLLAPALSGNIRVQGHPSYAIKVVLNGMKGKIEGKSYAGDIMAPNKEQNDQWVADVVSYIRKELSNGAGFVNAEYVQSIRESMQSEEIYEYDHLKTEIPQILKPETNWNISASHTFTRRKGGNIDPKTAFNFEGWSTGENQEAGMWYQVEFSEEKSINEIQFESPRQIKPGYRWGQSEGPPPFYSTHPRKLDILASEDGKSWKKIRENYSAQENENIIVMNEFKAKYLKFELKEKIESEFPIPWEMRSLKIFGK